MKKKLIKWPIWNKSNSNEVRILFRSFSSLSAHVNYMRSAAPLVKDKLTAILIVLQRWFKSAVHYYRQIEKYKKLFASLWSVA